MNATAQKRIDELNTKQAKEIAKLERELEVIGKLPEDLPEPRFIHVGSKLYGTDLALEFGDTGRFHYGTEEQPQTKRPYSMADAIELLRALGEAVPFFSVKDSCLALKPEDSITDAEHERATITGPYACKITLDGWHRKLQAFVTLKSGQMARVAIELESAAKLGYWSRVPGVGRADVSDQWQYTKVFAPLGQARTVSYGGGSHRGDGSKGQMVYCFTFIDDIKVPA